MALARLEFFRIDGLAPSLTLSAAALLHMLNALPNQKNGRFPVLRKMSDSNGHTVVKRLLAVFPATLCYHSQIKVLFSCLSVRTRFFTDASAPFVCCGLDCLSTILKFLQDVNIYYSHASKHYQLLSVLFSHIYPQFQVRYHPFSLYTIIMNNVRYGTIPSHRIFNILSDSLFSLGIVLHLLFRVKQHQKSCMSENAVPLVSLLDLYHFKDFHRI